jgi:hypothetical protein
MTSKVRDIINESMVIRSECLKIGCDAIKIAGALSER